MRHFIRWAEWLAEGSVGPVAAAIVVVAAYCCAQVVVLPLLSLWAGTGVGVDDAEQLMYMQRFLAGYGGSQPPLYTWMNWGAAYVLGTSIFTLKLVKYCVLFLACWATFATMRRLRFQKTTAVAAMFCLFCVPQIIWESQRALSHSVAALGFCALLAWATAYLVTRQSMVAYVLFGLSASAAILAKYNDVLLPVALVAAVLSIREFRGSMLNPKILVSLAVAALALGPTAYWNFTHRADLLVRQNKFGMQLEQGHLAAAGKGFAALCLAIVDFAFLPTLVFVVALLAAGLRPSDRGNMPPPPTKERLLWLSLGFGIATVAALVLLSGATEVRSRWLMPILYMLPLAIAAYTDRLPAPRGRSAQLFIIGSGAIFAALSMAGTWYFQVTGGSGQASLLQMNYPVLYNQLTADGPVKTIVSDKQFIGNFRLIDPGLITLDDEAANFSELVEAPIVLVWLNQDAPDSSILEKIRRAGYHASGSPRSIAVEEMTSKRSRKVFFQRLEK